MKTKSLEDTAGDEDEDPVYGINPKETLYPAGRTIFNSFTFHKSDCIIFKELLSQMKLTKLHQLINNTYH